MQRKMVVLGQEVLVTDRIPYKDKMEAAQEYAAKATVFDEELGWAYDSPLRNAIEHFIKLKYYTGLDMSQYEDYDGLCQMMDDIGEHPIKDVLEFIHDDWDELYDMAYDMQLNVERAYEKQHSLEHQIKTSFGFLFDGKDLTQTLAEAREVNEQMIDHLGALAKQNKPIDMSEYAKKKK